MAKAPSFQWYPNDYLRDTRILSLSSRGAWADMLNYMWYSEERGVLSGTVEQFSRMLSCSKNEIEGVLEELNVTKVADVTNRNGIVTVINRRMLREEKERNSTRLRVQKYRNAQCNESSNVSVTVPSSTSSSSSIKKENTKRKISSSCSDDFEVFWKEYPKKVGKDAARRAWKTRNGTRPPIADLVTAIRKQTQSIQWNKDGGQYIPNPATWINQGRWSDEMEVNNGKPGGSGQSVSGSWIPPEYKSESAPEISEDERQRNLARIRAITKGAC